MRLWDSRSGPSSRYRLSKEAIDIIHGRCSELPPLFPRLQTIVASLSAFHPFLISASISRLDIRLDRGPDSLILYGYRRVSDTPDLRSVAQPHHTTKLLLDSNAEFCSIIRRLPDLEEIVLPFRYVDAPLAKALSLHKNLRKIISDIPQPRSRYFLPYLETKHLFPSEYDLDSGAFPALTTFHVPACTISEVYAYITFRFFPLRNLTSLGILLPVMARNHVTKEWHPNFSDEELEELISNLAAGCPSLETLDIRLHEEKNNRMDDIVDELMPLDIADLTRGILRFNSLFTFRIYHPYPIRANNTDIAHLSREWPHLRGLHLSPCPLIDTPHDLSLDSLISLTTNCPEIEEIGLFIDGRVPDYRDRSRQPTLQRLLSKPTKLWIGHSSPLPTHRSAFYDIYPSIAQYLASLPFSSCVWYWTDELTFEQGRQQNDLGWRTVAAMVDLILQARSLARMSTLPHSCPSCL